MLISQYIIGTRRLLNDATGNYWKDPELVDYINEARNKCAIDTACVREFQEATLTTGVDKYLFYPFLPQGQRTVDIINLTLIYGATRVPLFYFPFTDFSAYYRAWTNYKTLPRAYTIYGANAVWLAPVPDQAYAGEYDTAVTPQPLQNDNDVDVIPIPYSDAVKYYAARLAKLRMQQYEEALAYENLYKQRINELNAMYPRRIPYVYGTGEFGF